MIRALVSMMAAAAVCVAAMPLAGCVTATNSYSKARTAVEVADSAFARIEKRATAALPLLPEPTANRVRAALAIANLALAAAHGAVDQEELDDQLGRAVDAVAEIAAALRQR